MNLLVMEIHKPGDFYLLDVQEDVPNDDESNYVSSIAELLDERVVLEEKLYGNYQNNLDITQILIKLTQIEEDLQILGW
jgi:protein associated with RNAse G/E